jgi:hypothetical protein
VLFSQLVYAVLMLQREDLVAWLLAEEWATARLAAGYRSHRS